MRLYVVGTDTGVGKTRVTAALARAARGPVTIVKLVQTGLAPGEPGDAEDAARLADAARGATDASLAMPWRELARLREPADPWNAALEAGMAPLEAGPLVAALDTIAGDLIVEGSGGAAVPLNARSSLSDVALAAHCEAVLAIGLRLGCINHALLTLDYLAHLGMRVCGAITTEAFGPVAPAYRRQVERALAAKIALAAHLPYDSDGVRSVASAAPRLDPLVSSFPLE